MQLGWADLDFKAAIDEGKGAGDDVHSWAYDGFRCLKWHSNKKEGFGKKWKAGDVIGAAIDLDGSPSVSFSLNGDWTGMGVAFEGLRPRGAVYPCITLLRGERVELFLGVHGNKFIHSPPSDEYKPLRVTQPLKSDQQESRFTGFTPVIEMGLSEHSFTISFPGEMMVNVMGRGLDYEAKKNALIHAGYAETMKRWEKSNDDITKNTEGKMLTKDEIFALICYTLEHPPVYRHFNNDTRKGYQGDGMDFPILSHLLREGCRKILAGLPENARTRQVYRGVNVSFNAKVGETVRFGSYTSTSESTKVVQGFMKGGTGGTLFIITSKIGAPIKALSQYPEEEEVVIPPYETFKVTKIEQSKIYLESSVPDDSVAQYVVSGAITWNK